MLGARGSNISPHTCKPQFSPCKPHANMHTGTDVAPHARLVPLLMLAHLLHPMQNPCQLWTKRRKVLQHKQNTCQLLSCKSRANSYPQVIHRLPHAILVPTLRPSKTRANFGHAKVVPMLGRGRGLTCVDNCSSYLGTKKVKTRKKEP